MQAYPTAATFHSPTTPPMATGAPEELQRLDEHVVEHIPDELKMLRQWVGCKGKLPINPHTGRSASATDPTTWGDVEHALAAVERYHLDGIGFVFTGCDQYLFIDIDHCIDPATGEIEARAQGFVDRIPGYWETSTRGGGLHGIVRAVKPGDRCRTGNVEMYDQNRFMVWTGRTLPGCETIRSGQAAVTALYRELFPPESPRPPAPPPSMTIEDQDIIDRLRLQNDGGMASRLIDGGLCGKTSASEARFALAMRACFYSDNPDQIARILRGSAAWNTTDRDQDRDRKAAHDARRAIAKYDGERFTPGSPPMIADRQPTENQPDASEGDTCSAQLAEARREIAALKQDRDTLLALVLNPHVSIAEKMAVAGTIDRAIRNPVEDDGFVTVKPAEIANDWRPKPQRGQNTAPLNRDGSKPRMNRTAVRKTMMVLTQRGFKAHPTKQDVKPKGAGREPYKETVWRVKPPTNMAEFLAPIAMYQPATITPRKARVIAPQCSECGIDLNVTMWTVTEMACPECGEVHRTESAPRTVHPVIVIDPQDHGDNLSPVSGVFTTGDNLSPKAGVFSTGDNLSFVPPPDSDAPPEGWVLPPHGVAGDDRFTA